MVNTPECWVSNIERSMHDFGLLEPSCFNLDEPIHIGPPKSTPEYTSDQLLTMGFLGVYTGTRPE